MPIALHDGIRQVRGEVNPSRQCETTMSIAVHTVLKSGEAPTRTTQTEFYTLFKVREPSPSGFAFPPSSENDALEMKLRRVLKEKLARGHIEVSLNVDHGGVEAFSINRNFVGGYINAFRAAAAEFGVSADPDLNVVLRLPGALSATVATGGW